MSETIRDKYTEETGYMDYMYSDGWDSYYTKDFGHWMESKLEEITEGNWISVSDDMPDDGDVVLCYVKDGSMVFATCHNKDNDGRFQHGTTFYWAGTEVSHWQPLPQAPSPSMKNDAK